MTYSNLMRPNLDDFIGSDDQKLASALASGINELQISRQVMLTATQTPRNGMTIYGAGKFAADNATNPVVVQKNTPGDFFNSYGGITGFYIRDLSFDGLGYAAQCIALNDPDECGVVNCLIRHCLGNGINLNGNSVNCLIENNRIVAAGLRDVGARGIYLYAAGNANTVRKNYVIGYSTGIDSASAATVLDQNTIETCDWAICVSSADCAIRGGLVNNLSAGGKAIVQKAGATVFNDFMRNAYSGNCVVADSRFTANWNPA